MNRLLFIPASASVWFTLILSSIVILTVAGCVSLQNSITAPAATVVYSSPDIHLPRTISVGSENDSSDRYLVVVPPNENTERLCVAIEQGAFWEAGIASEDLKQHLIESLRIAVDDQLIPREGIQIADYLIESFRQYDAKGNENGSYGGPLDVCFPTQGFNPGRHEATIQASAVSGTVYVFTWQFNVENEVE